MEMGVWQEIVQYLFYSARPTVQFGLKQYYVCISYAIKKINPIQVRPTFVEWRANYKTSALASVLALCKVSELLLSMQDKQEDIDIL